MRASSFVILVFVILISLATVGSANLVDGLLGSYSFDGNSYDSSGNSRHAAIHGAQWTIGRFGQGLSLDGTDDYIGLPDNEPVWLPQGDFTISVWAYFDDDRTQIQNLLDLNAAGSGSSSNRQGIALQKYLGTSVLSTVTVNGHVDVLYGTTDLLSDIWYHLVAVREGTTQSIYVNGVLDASGLCASGPIDYVSGYDDNRVNLGRVSRAGSIGSYLAGDLDEIRIYDRALSESEIQMLVPEPGSLCLLALGTLLLRRRRTAQTV